MIYLDAIHNFLSGVEVYISLLTFASAAGTFLIVTLGQKRKERQILNRLIQDPGEKPAVFIVDLVQGRNMKHDILNYLSNNENLRDINEDRIVILNEQDLSCGNNVTPSDINEFIEVLRKKENELNDIGYDVIHYFHGGPAMLAALVGARWGNWGRVNLYQHSPGAAGGSYQAWGPLRHYVL